MSKAQLVITAVVLEGRSKSEVARDYGLSRYWVHQLVGRGGSGAAEIADEAEAGKADRTSLAETLRR
jgi:hypothetical protein